MLDRQSHQGNSLGGRLRSLGSNGDMRPHVGHIDQLRIPLFAQLPNPLDTERPVRGVTRLQVSTRLAAVADQKPSISELDETVSPRAVSHIAAMPSAPVRL
jgi:hypothetical protein